MAIYRQTGGRVVTGNDMVKVYGAAPLLGTDFVVSGVCRSVDSYLTSPVVHFFIYFSIIWVI